MHEVEQLVSRLRGPAPPPTPPPWPRSRAGAAALVASLAAAALLALLVPRGEPYVASRGVADKAPPMVDLRLAVERDGRALRTSTGEAYRPGERIFFRVAATPDSPVRLWVEGPDGRTEIAIVDAQRVPADVRSEAGLVAYELDGPGRYLFVASTDNSVPCPSTSCVEREILVP